MDLPPLVRQMAIDCQRSVAVKIQSRIIDQRFSPRIHDTAWHCSIGLEKDLKLAKVVLVQVNKRFPGPYLDSCARRVDEVDTVLVDLVGRVAKRERQVGRRFVLAHIGVVQRDSKKLAITFDLKEALQVLVSLNGHLLVLIVFVQVNVEVNGHGHDHVVVVIGFNVSFAEHNLLEWRYGTQSFDQVVVTLNSGTLSDLPTQSLEQKSGAYRQQWHK